MPGGLQVGVGEHGVASAADLPVRRRLGLRQHLHHGAAFGANLLE